MKLAEDLKKAVLQAAMQGKLTKQLETDSSVDELLKKIAEEKERLVIRKNAREDKDYGAIQENEIEFEIPASWRWIRISNIGVYKKGPFGSALTKSIFVTKSENSVKVYEQKNAIQKDSSIGEYYISKEYYETKMKSFTVESGDIIVSCAGTIGETFILPDNIELGIINQALMRMNIAEPINVDFFLYYFDHVLKQNAKKESSGSAIKNIPPFDIFKAMLFPLPPMEEQQRIVEKLNQILPLIEEYGKEEDELIALCQKFPEEMKKSVLQAAMQGKLTKQLETDSSVDELLKKIADEKVKLIEEGKIRKGTTKAGSSGRALAEITEEEIPFDIPENWRWTRLRNIVYSRGQKTPDKKFSYIDIGSINNQKQILSKNENIIEAKDAPSRARKIVAKNDVIYSTVRPYLHNMCIIDKDFSEEPIASTGFAVMTCIKILPEFLLKYLLSPDFDAYANDHENSKGVAYPAINDDRLYKALIPIPPIEEQQRIVEKLNTILPIIDSMAVYGTKKKAGRPKQEEALSFISSLLGTQKSSDSKPVSPEILELTAKAKEELPAIVKKYAELMDVTYNRITIRHQKTRWGSCTKTGNLNFNCLIMKMPETVRDYVIIHELSHRKELNHSTKFWAVVAEYCPWYKEAKQWLKENGQKLMER